MTVSSISLRRNWILIFLPTEESNFFSAPLSTQGVRVRFVKIEIRSLAFGQMLNAVDYPLTRLRDMHFIFVFRAEILGIKQFDDWNE